MKAALVAALALAGCTTVFWETGRPTDSERWRTETRSQWYWVGIPTWVAPVDIYFPTQAGCEHFRELHPTYTRPDEVCVAVRGISTPWLR